MPQRTLRYCRKCLCTQQAFARQTCATCGEELLPLLDENGALSRGFLEARGTCCTTGCRNCPYSADPGVKTKRCERCAAEFECHSHDCWCGSLSVRPATLRWLQRTYTDCLCPNCLNEFARG